jgi:hypothetical protein
VGSFCMLVDDEGSLAIWLTGGQVYESVFKGGLRYSYTLKDLRRLK